MARGGKRSGCILAFVAALLEGLQCLQPSNDAPFVAGRLGLSSVDNAPKSKDFALKSKDFALKSKDFALKSKDFALKSKDFALKSTDNAPLRSTRERQGARFPPLWIALILGVPFVGRGRN
jgi:hypothetical protein